ncbi:hypothetical protein ACOMHN_017899 [Nucella lapillus]
MRRNRGAGSTCREYQGVFAYVNGGVISTNPLIGSIIGVALILGICITLGVIILKRRSARSEETRQNNQASNDLNLSPTSPRPEAPGHRQERTTVFQEQEPIYEIADDRVKATKLSAVSDTVYQQSEADSANPYDLPTVEYCNTADVHLYDHWPASRAPQQDAQTARAGGSGGKRKAAKQQTPRP